MTINDLYEVLKEEFGKYVDMTFKGNVLIVEANHGTMRIRDVDDETNEFHRAGLGMKGIVTSEQIIKDLWNAC